METTNLQCAIRNPESEYVFPVLIGSTIALLGVSFLLKKVGSTDFVRGLPTQKLLAKYRRATVHYSK